MGDFPSISLVFDTDTEEGVLEIRMDLVDRGVHLLKDTELFPEEVEEAAAPATEPPSQLGRKATHVVILSRIGKFAARLVGEVLHAEKIWWFGVTVREGHDCVRAETDLEASLKRTMVPRD